VRFGTRIMLVRVYQFWDQKVRVQGHTGFNMLENVLLALLKQRVENYRSEFHQTFSVDAFWNEDGCTNFWSQKVKGQGHSMTKGPAGWHTELDTVCRVLISSYWAKLVI